MTKPIVSDELCGLLKAVFCLLFLLMLAACSAAVQPSNPTSDRAAIEELSQQFSSAFMRGDAAAQAAIYTPDAVIFPGTS